MEVAFEEVSQLPSFQSPHHGLEQSQLQMYNLELYFLITRVLWPLFFLLGIEKMFPVNVNQ